MDLAEMIRQAAEKREAERTSSVPADKPAPKQQAKPTGKQQQPAQPKPTAPKPQASQQTGQTQPSKLTAPKLRPRMEPPAITEVIESVKPGNVIEIQFPKEGALDIRYLRIAMLSGMVSPVEGSSNMAEALMMAIMMSQSWDMQINRIWRMKAENSWNAEAFLQNLHSRRLEAVTILS